MNTKTSVLDADVATADDQLKAAVLRDLTPRELAERLLVASRDDEGQELEGAFRTLMMAADHVHLVRVLDGRTKDELSDDEYETAQDGADPFVIIRTLVDDYNVKTVVRWVKKAVEELGKENEDE